MLERVASGLGIALELSSNQSPQDRARLGIVATPAVAVDGQVVHSGGVPSHHQVEAWLRPRPLELLKHPTRHMFFTGKGGRRQDIAFRRSGAVPGGLRQAGAAGEHGLGIQSG